MLSVDLSQMLIAHTIAFDNASEVAVRALGSRHFLVSRPFWLNLMRNVSDDGVTVAELRAAAPGSPVKSMLGGLERWGYVAIGDAASGGPRSGFGSARGLTDTVSVRRTPFGRSACEIWVQADADVTGQWDAHFGAGAIATLVDDLGALAEAVSARTLPDALPLVAPSDGFRTDPACAEAEGRGDAPLPALLARLLIAFTLAFERDSELSLPLAADFLPVLGEEPVPMRDLPAQANVTREAVRMAVGFLQRRELAAVVANAAGKGQAASLTPRGLAVRVECDARLAAVERDWASSCDGVGRVAAGLGAILDSGGLVEALTPPPNGWRLTKPYDAQTRKMLDDPRAGLPRQPMVLHRGGWPDGA
jgi:hypothetical protein